jgi:serine/threonine protein kinase
MCTLVQSLRIKRHMHISIDPTLCALLTCLDISEALKFMHKSKTLHGDLKPHNILLVSAPQVRSTQLKPLSASHVLLLLVAAVACRPENQRLRWSIRLSKRCGRGAYLPTFRST